MDDNFCCVTCDAKLHLFLTHVYDPHSGEQFSIFKCKNCALEMTYPLPVNLGSYYPNTYHGGRHGFTDRYCVQRRINWIKQFNYRADPKLLDIGCGEGSFLLEAKRMGWRVAGTEFNVNFAKSVDLDVKQNLEEVKRDDMFDCVTLWHSLEHITNPKKTLEQVNQLLSPHGVLFIAVPNAKGWQARLFGRKWLHRDVPRHLYHFDPTSLDFLLKTNGFKVLKCWHQELEYDILGWSQSALNWISSKPNVFFNLLTHRGKGIRKSEKILNWIGGVIFSGIAIPLVILSSMFKAGGTVIIAAQKQS